MFWKWIIHLFQHCHKCLILLHGCCLHSRLLVLAMLVSSTISTIMLIFVVCSSTSKWILASSGPVIILLLSAPWLSEPFTYALLCWCTMTENLLPVVCTAHYPDMHYMGHLDVLQRVLPYLECVREAIWSSAFIMTQGANIHNDKTNILQIGYLLWWGRHF